MLYCEWFRKFDVSSVIAVRRYVAYSTVTIHSHELKYPPSVNKPKVGMQYSLTCSAGGPGQLHPSITYQWYKDGIELSNKTSSELSFDVLSICDAGNYSCHTSVTGSTLHEFELSFSSKHH